MILDYIKKCEQSMLATTIITLILGLVLAIAPMGSLTFIICIIGFLFILLGVFQIYNYITMNKLEKFMSFSLLLGIVSLCIGLFMVLNTSSLIKFATVIIGIAIFIKGLFKIQFSMNLKTYTDRWYLSLLLGFLSIALSILVIINPWDTAETFIRVVGILIALGSVADLIETACALSTVSKVKEEVASVKKEFKEAATELDFVEKANKKDEK